MPRIPSVTSTILAASTASHYFSGHPGRTGSGRHSPSETERETMEIAALEIARMSEEIDGFRNELLIEQQKRIELEAHIESMKDREVEIEAEVREECYLEMEERFAREMQKWKNTLAEEAERGVEHVDRKLEILTRMGEADDEDKENINAGEAQLDLESENEKLRREIEMLRREVGSKSPSKKERVREPLRETLTLEGLSLGDRDENMRGSSSRGLKERERERSSSPTKKVVRKLVARKWGPEKDDEDVTF